MFALCEGAGGAATLYCTALLCAGSNNTPSSSADGEHCATTSACEGPSALAHPLREVVDLTDDAPVAAHAHAHSHDADADADAAAPGGSVVVLGVIKASGRTARAVGADFIVSPVRRSVRGGGGASPQPPLPALLAETGFAYVPNHALGAVGGGGGGAAAAAGGVAMLGSRGGPALAPAAYVDLVSAAAAASTVKRPPRRGVALTPGPLVVPATVRTCSPHTERALSLDA